MPQSYRAVDGFRRLRHGSYDPFRLRANGRYAPRQMDRVTLGKMQNPIRGFLHGSAAVAAAIGLWILLDRSGGNTAAITGGVVFGTALLVMYTVSSLYHSVPWGPEWKLRFQRIDHSLIFLVVAGTFTPIAIASLDGLVLAIALAIMWGIALTGIMLKVLMPNVRTHLSVTLQMVMGWSALIWIPWIWRELGPGAIALIFLGGACYTIGTVIYAIRRPILFPRTFSNHELFHVLVIGGSAFHFFAVLLFAIPAIG